MKILLLDDNTDVNESIQDAFEEYGIDSDSFTEPFVALESFKTHKYDIIVTDYQMPQMNGVEFFNKIKEINKKTHIIMMSAYADENLIQKCINKGMFAFLKKPVNINELIRLCIYLKD